MNNFLSNKKALRLITPDSAAHSVMLKEPQEFNQLRRGFHEVDAP